MRTLCTICKFLNYQNNSRIVRHFTVSLCQRSGLEGIGTGKSACLEINLDSTAETYLTENNLKPKNHPGVHHLTRQSLPPKFVASARRLLTHENVKAIASGCKELRNILWSRLLPMEEHDFKIKADEIQSTLDSNDDIMRPFMSEEQLKKLDNSKINKFKKRLRVELHHWRQINYDRHKSLQYLLSRSAGEYAALIQIFSEIKQRDPSFEPNTLCDFGSGLGTVVWASKTTWPKNIKEVLCADISSDMNEIAESLLRGANPNNDHGFMGLYFRQFLAESTKVNYNLVVSAYSFLELPSLKARLKQIDILWKKTDKYLVIVEQGTNAGFKAVIEARDYILQLDRGGSAVSTCHVFSPCPNIKPCPRFNKDEIPCNFYVKCEALYPYKKNLTNTEVFCYVVLKKGKRSKNDPQWPRLIRDPMIRNRHTICRVCTKEGKLVEVVVTKTKHSQTLYGIARKSSCGDLLPVLELETDKSTEIQNAEEIKQIYVNEMTQDNLNDEPNNCQQ